MRVDISAVRAVVCAAHLTVVGACSGPRAGADLPRVAGIGGTPPCPPGTPLYTGDSVTLSGPPRSLVGLALDDETGAPVAGVGFERIGGRSATGDARGYFEIAPDSAPVWQLRVRRIGYATYRVTVVWRPGVEVGSHGRAGGSDTLTVRLLRQRCGILS